MVNYCCVQGCGRNSRVHKHLNYYSLPKGIERQEQWLEAAGRKDLFDKMPSSSTRFCSRHFAPTQIMKRRLHPEAVPSLYLPGSKNIVNQDTLPVQHTGVVCNGCQEPVLGFRYKCIVCQDYDLCHKCEMNEVHPDHLVIRIAKPLKFTKANTLISKWRSLIKNDIVQFLGKSENNSDSEANGDTSSDDEPIQKYTKEYDGGVDLPDDVKKKIRNEVARVVKLEQKGESQEVSAKRSAESSKTSKRMRTETENNDDSEVQIPELAFADVGEMRIDSIIKQEPATEPTKPHSLHKRGKDLFVVLQDEISELIDKVQRDPEFI